MKGGGKHKHNNPEDLEEILRATLVRGQHKTARPWKKVLIVVEGSLSLLLMKAGAEEGHNQGHVTRLPSRSGQGPGCLALLLLLLRIKVVTCVWLNNFNFMHENFRLEASFSLK